MNFADQKMVKKLRKEFPVGCRIVLDEMDDRQAPPIGMQGTCNGVDDAGNILVSWDTGSHLNVAYGADSCHRVATDAEVKVSLDHLGKTRQTGPCRAKGEGRRTESCERSEYDHGFGRKGSRCTGQQELFRHGRIGESQYPWGTIGGR